MKTEIAERNSVSIETETAARSAGNMSAPARKKREISVLALVFAVLTVALLFQFANLAIVRLLPWVSLLTRR